MAIYSMFRTFLGYSNILITMVIFILPKSAEIKFSTKLGSGFESAKIHFFLFSDSRDPIIYYHKLRKLKFASHFIVYQKCPLRGHLGLAGYTQSSGTGELRTYDCDLG